ncbi:hypothetical protein [Piscinibacter sp.]|uniref:hypothetical protein n=1 Tax=Piscinibacter sp. TaxID=1903157 RepID=UPI002ED67B3A
MVVDTTLPFGTLAFKVSGGVLLGDSFAYRWTDDVSKFFGASFDGQCRIDGNLVYIHLPPGVADRTSAVVAGPVDITLSRTSNGVSETISLLRHRVDNMLPSPFAPGSLALLLMNMQLQMTAQGAVALVSSGRSQQAVQDAYKTATFPNGAMPALRAMTGDQLALLDKMFYAYFRACGVDLTAVRRAEAVRALGDKRALDDFDLNALIPKMGNDIRGICDNLMRAGSLVTSVGALAAAAGIAGGAPLAVAGAVAVLVGFGMGMTQGFLYDNLSLFAGAGDDTAPQVEGTIKFVAGHAASEALKAVDVFGSAVVEGLAESGQYFKAFIADQVQSFGLDELVDKTVDKLYEVLPGVFSRSRSYPLSTVGLPDPPQATYDCSHPPPWSTRVC